MRYAERVPSVRQIFMDAKQPLSPLFVTQPSLPPLEEFVPYLEKIWASKRLTNGGPMHEALEAALCDYLGVRHVSLFNNGTMGLLTALQALRVTGEVITTPYSFVATSHALLWNGLTPVFVDVDPDTLNLDPSKIEAAITPRTTAILPVHCYGTPCDVTAIREIADRYDLKVIYDAAHVFGVQDDGGSILRHGDLSVLSFHATKVFNTFEGGAIISPDEKTKRRIDRLKNFGFVDEVTVVAAGVNGKMSEINAAMGLLQLKHVQEAINRRAVAAQYYLKGLSGIKGLRCLRFEHAARANYAYFPVFVGPDHPRSRDELYSHLKEHGVHGRRYFYPLITDFPMYRSSDPARAASYPVARRAAEQVICLPMSADITTSDLDRVIGLIADS
jgi:dTDP-4-amino-4,6-dideoxygalactose transaminase